MFQKRVLVTGGGGMVGRAVKKIVDEKRDITNEYLFSSSRDCDLRNFQSTQKLFSDFAPTHVIHLAANVGGLFKNLERGGEMFMDNVLMNTNVLELCRVFKVERVVCCLSTCIFPNCEDERYPLSEDAIHDGPPHVSNEGYAYSKRMMEVMARLYSKQYGIDVVCVAPCNIYGPGDHFNSNDAHIIPSLISRFRNTPSNPVVYGSGTPVRQFIFSEDVARQILTICFSPNHTYPLYVLAPSDEVSIKDTAVIIAKALDIDPDKIYFDKSKSDGQYRKSVLSTRYDQDFGKFSYTPLEQGIAIVVNSLE